MNELKKQPGVTRKIKTGCGSLFITVVIDKNKTPVKVFCNLGKAGGCESVQMHTLGKLVSLLLKLGADLGTVISDLEQEKCHKWRPGCGNVEVFNSCADALAFVLKEYQG